MSYILQSIKLHLGICAINPVISLPIKKAKLSQDLKKHFTARKKKLLKVSKANYLFIR